ncbi:hypothetical protein MCJ35_16080 [Enterocloster sp. OA13]|nr:hypothetical protein [Enterocloster sp. OA13]
MSQYYKFVKIILIEAKSTAITFPPFIGSANSNVLSTFPINSVPDANTGITTEAAINSKLFSCKAVLRIFDIPNSNPIANGIPEKCGCQLPFLYCIQLMSRQNKKAIKYDTVKKTILYSGSA